MSHKRCYAKFMERNSAVSAYIVSKLRSVAE